MAGPLVLKFGVDFADAQKGLASFAANTVSTMASVAGAARNASTAMSLLGTVIPAIRIGVGVLAGYELLKAAMGDVQSKIQDMVQVADAAGKAGVSTNLFQAWNDKAKELGLTSESLVSMFEKLKDASTIKLGEGGGENSSALQDRLGEHVKAGNLSQPDVDTFNKADDGDAKVKATLDIIQKLEDAGRQLAAYDIAGKAFGGDFESKLRNGVDMVGKMRTAMTNTANVQWSPELIAGAQQIKDQVEEASNKLSNDWMPAQQTIASFEMEAAKQWAAMKIDVLTIADSGVKILNWIGEMATKIAGISDSAFIQILGGDWTKMVPESIRNAVTGMMNGPLGEAPPVTVPGPRNKRPPPDLSNHLGSASPKAAAASTTDEVQTYIDGLQKSAAAEEAEAATLGLGNKAKAEAIDLAKAKAIADANGSTVTEKQTAEIIKYADAQVAAKAQIDAFSKSQEQAKQTADFFGQSLEGAVEKLATHSGTLKESLTGIVEALEKAAIQAAILGSGPLAGLFGTAPASGATGTGAIGGLFGMGVKGMFGSSGSLASQDAAQDAAQDAEDGTGSAAAGGGFLSSIFGLFSGFHAAGGTIPTGSWGIAGEAGPEIIHGPAAITPTAAIVRGGGGGGGTTQLTHSPTIVVPPGFTQDQASAMIARSQKDFARNILPVINNAQRRYGG